MIGKQREDSIEKRKSILTKINERRPIRKFPMFGGPGGGSVGVGPGGVPRGVYDDKALYIVDMSAPNSASVGDTITTDIDVKCECGAQETECEEGDDCSEGEFSVELKRKEVGSAFGFGLIKKTEWVTLKTSTKLNPKGLVAGKASSGVPSEKFTLDKPGEYEIVWHSAGGAATRKFTVSE